jgi:hypothetical protein
MGAAAGVLLESVYFKHLKIELSSQVIRERIIQVKELERLILCT